MLRLIHAEIYKLFKTRIFIVLCIVAIVIGMIIVGTSKIMSSEDVIRSSLQGMSKQQQDQMINQLKQDSSNNSNNSVFKGGNLGFHNISKDLFHPKVREIFHNSFGSGIIEILIAILVANLIAKEYTTGTIKNILAYGKKREHYYIAKLIATSIGFTILLGIMVAVGTLGSTLFFTWGVPFNGAELLGIIKTFALAILIGIATTSFIMLISTLLKSSALTIAIGVVVFSNVAALLGILYGSFDWFDKIYRCTLSYNWAVGTSINAGSSDIFRAVVVSIITIFITGILGILVLKRQDIK
ncbi:ABC transporter permease subunit [Clostridium arbusti]|uniref:ABC transporter permease subunit n=1 Tax=Clostridium arbusti TaxID=1137848 RepID=UPI000287D346|nr:ABC transporter permease subunit [Clostridium arbusti]